MKNSKLKYAFEDMPLILEKYIENPLFLAISRIIGRLSNFKQNARAFYFEVVLSPYQCPKCGGQMRCIVRSHFLGSKLPSQGNGGPFARVFTTWIVINIICILAFLLAKEIAMAKIGTGIVLGLAVLGGITIFIRRSIK